MKKIYLVPREGLSVPDPEAKDHLPPEGREVRDSPYWRRRLRDKEVSVGDLEAVKAEAEARELLRAIKAEEATRAEEAAKAEEVAKAEEESPKAEDAPEETETVVAAEAAETLFEDDPATEEAPKAKSKAKSKAKAGEEAEDK